LLIQEIQFVAQGLHTLLVLNPYPEVQTSQLPAPDILQLAQLEAHMPQVPFDIGPYPWLHWRQVETVEQVVQLRVHWVHTLLINPYPLEQETQLEPLQLTQFAIEGVQLLYIIIIC